MSDLRDAGERTVAAADLEIQPPVRRRTIVSTFLAPLRRVALRPDEGRPLQDSPLQGRPLQDIDRPRMGPEPQSGGHFNLILISIVLVVLLPIFATGTYLFGFASDQYVAEARFAVRTASGAVDTGTVESGTPAAGALPGQNAYIVADYIHSRAIVADISRDIDIRAIFQRPEADFYARLPKNASMEDLTDYWNSMVSVYVENTSGIVTIETRAFRRDDALVLASAAVKASEKLVNDLTVAIRADAMHRAEDEVRRSEALVRFALSDLTAFRNSQGLIDPVKSADLSGKLLLQLMTDEITTESQLFVAQRVMGPAAPGLEATRAKLESVKSQITSLKDQMAGVKDNQNNMAASISRFEQLELKRLFSERMFMFAQDGINRARKNAEQQALYLALFSPPALPEDSAYPLRISDFVLIAGALILLWCSGATIWASVLDHRL